MNPSGMESFLGLSSIDQRWGFDRLPGLVAEHVGRAARSGARFILLLGKRKKRAEICSSMAADSCCSTATISPSICNTG
jgi:hypothetical protein